MQVMLHFTCLKYNRPPKVTSGGGFVSGNPPAKKDIDSLHPILYFATANLVRQLQHLLAFTLPKLISSC
jgi:hypothetical protein